MARKNHTWKAFRGKKDRHWSLIRYNVKEVMVFAKTLISQSNWEGSVRIKWPHKRETSLKNKMSIYWDDMSCISQYAIGMN